MTLREEPRLARSVPRLVRFAAFLPVLLWEVAKANVAVASAILHPSLPIEPTMATVDTGPREGLEQMVLANSITLTPGTVVVDVRDDELLVHGLTPGAVEALEGGRLPRLVAWVFHGGRDG